MKVIKIGKQTWTAENLNVTKFRNGDLIPEIKDGKEWKNATGPGYCYINNNPENGILYNWHAVNDSRGLAMEGYHIPSKEEFETLIQELGEGNCFKLKSKLSKHWNMVGIENGTDEFGFGSIAVGLREAGWSNGEFMNEKEYTGYWSSDTYNDKLASFMLLGCSSFAEVQDSKMNYGYSVRILKD